MVEQGLGILGVLDPSSLKGDFVFVKLIVDTKPNT